MPRNGSGNYTVPATVNPVVPGTDITADWANTTLTDLAQGVTDSLDRNGRGGMLAAFKVADGAVGAPGVAFTNETSTGFYRASAAKVGFAVLGTNVVDIEAAKITWKFVLQAPNLILGGTGTEIATWTAGGVDPNSMIQYPGTPLIVLNTTGPSKAAAITAVGHDAPGVRVIAYDTPGTALDLLPQRTLIQFGRTQDLTAVSSPGSPNAYTGSITVGAAGGAISYNTSSDYRLKTNITPLMGAALPLLRKLRPVTFNWKDNRTAAPVMGFLAHEVQEVCPQAVVGEKDGEGQYQQMDSSHLIPILVAALQDALVRIKVLEDLVVGS